MSSNPTIHIIPEDIQTFAPTIASFEAKVFNTFDAFSRLAYGPQASTTAGLSNRIANLRNIPSGVEVHVTKAVIIDANDQDPDYKEEIVGIAVWAIRKHPWNPSEDDGRLRKEGFADGANMSLIEQSLGRGVRNCVRCMRGRAFVSLNILMVSRDHQRKGIGSALLEEGLALAEKLDLPVWLQASKSGRGLYVKHGFVVDEAWEVDLEPYGVDVVEPFACMIRDAKT